MNQQLKNTLRPAHRLVKMLNFKKTYQQHKVLAARRSVEDIYRAQTPPLSTNPQAPVLLCEGMWDNPNHWFRLHLFIRAARQMQDFRLMGILRRRSDVLQKASLESLGVREFRYLEEDAPEAAQFEKQADELLSQVKDHRDFINLNLPEGLPAYTYYDTVLKKTRLAQPPLNSESWRRLLIQQLQTSAFYSRLFSEHKIWTVVSSHPWKSEWATLCWTTLKREIPFYYLNGMCESIRIRRMSNTNDYASPHEYLMRDEYESLPTDQRQRLIRRAENHLKERFSGQSSDINIRHAFQPDQRLSDRRQIRELIGAPVDKPMVVLYASVWFDFPHCCGMRTFTDFLDWMQFTLKTIRENTNVTWVLRPHPTEGWYAGVKLVDLAGKDLPSHIIVYNKKLDSLSMQSAADAIVTIHGTISTEAVARGIPTLCADRSYFSDWDFVRIAKNHDDYRQLLLTIQSLPKPTQEQRERSMVFGATAIGAPPQDLPHLHMSDDSLQDMLYDTLPKRLADDKRSIDSEVNKLTEWLKSGHHSYNVYRVLESTTESR